MIVGIDPGLSGGIAFLSDTIAVMPLQTIDNKIDLHWLREAFTFLDKSKTLVALEKVQAIFGSSAGATFSFGWGAGAIEGVLSSLKIPYELIAPKEWQKQLGIVQEKKATPKQRKEKNLAMCKNLFPDVNLLATQRSKVPHLGCVDALLIAEAVRRKTGHA